MDRADTAEPSKLPIALYVIAFLEIVAAAVAVAVASSFVVSGLQETARLNATHESGSAGLGVGIGNLFAIFLFYLGVALLVSGIPSAVASIRRAHGRSELSGARVGNLLVIGLNVFMCLALSSAEPYAAPYWLAFAVILSILPAICLVLVYVATKPPKAGWTRTDSPLPPVPPTAETHADAPTDTGRL